MFRFIPRSGFRTKFWISDQLGSIKKLLQGLFIDYHIIFFLQLLANFFIFACANGAGIFTHYSTELSRRKAFLETRKCIENRLKSQKANQNQVKFY